jgi:NDP-sugar pyrophosphorylase family protein
MQAVILAAGKGTRMGSLTVDIPKPLLTVGGKSVLEHKLDALPNIISEVIIITGYHGHLIQEKIGDRYNDLPIRYVEQTELKGTGHALWQAKDLITGKFMVMMGDDIYSKESMEQIIDHSWAMTTVSLPRHKATSHVVTNDQGELKELLFDKTRLPEECLLDICLYVLQKEIFDVDLVKLNEKDEYGLPHTIAKAAATIPVKIVGADRWIKINTPEDLVDAESLLLQQDR